MQGHNSPLPKTLLTKISTLTAIWSSQREGEEDVASIDKRENKYEKIDGGEDGGGWGWVCGADGGWGEIEKMWRDDEDQREGSVEKSIIPLHFIENY